MREKPTEEMIAKLPRWAQDHIKFLASEREQAIKAMNMQLDMQTPSKMYWDEYLSTGEAQAGPSSKRFWVQTDRIMVENCGVRLEVSCYEGNNMQYPSIGLKWEDVFGHGNHTAFIPTSFQSAALIAKHNLKITDIFPKLCLERHGSHLFKGGHCLHCGYAQKGAK